MLILNCFFKGGSGGASATNRSTQPRQSIYDLLIAKQKSTNATNEITAEVTNEVTDEVTDEPAVAQEETGQPYEWNLVQVFEDEATCTNFIDNENCWTKLRPIPTLNGIKTKHRCKFVRYRGKQCSAGIYTIHSKTPDDKSYTLYRKTSDHDHVGSENKPRPVLSPELKKVVEECIEGKQTLKTIMHKLREDNNNEGVGENQVRNYIKTYRKKRFGDSKVTVQDIIDFCQLYSAVPDGVDDAFVLRYDHSSVIEEAVDFDSYDPEKEEENSPWIRFIVTTKRLLLNSANSKIVHADATQKMIIQRYPVLVFGTTDLDTTQHFHLLGIMVSKYERTDDFKFGFDAINAGIMQVANVKFDPNFLMADAAGSIHAAAKLSYGDDIKVLMCFPHVKRNIGKQKLQESKVHMSEIKQDISKMKLAYNIDVFNRLAVQFLNKWGNLEDQFADYFEKTWIKRNSNWFNGAAVRTPSSNNALESFNGQLKIHHTFYQQKGLAEFKVHLLKIVTQRSTEYVQDRAAYQYEVAIPKRMEMDGLKYSKLKKINFRRSDDGHIVVYMSKGENADPITDADVDKFLALEHDSFDELTEHMFDMYILKFEEDTSKWMSATCTCPSFADSFMCKHILCVAFQLNFMSSKPFQQLQANTKPGRPKKATGPLVVD